MNWWDPIMLLGWAAMMLLGCVLIAKLMGDDFD